MGSVSKFKVGSTIISKTGELITVVGLIGKKHREITCSTCSPDTELYQEGTFIVPMPSLIHGRPRCGCSSWYVLDERQATILVKRKCIERSMQFKGFTNDFVDKSSKLTLVCPEGHTWDTVTLYNFLRGGTGCSKCMGKLISDRKSFKMVGESRVTGWGNTLTVVEELDRMHLSIHCDVCSQDLELYPRNFTQLRQSWAKRYVGCGCSKSYFYSPEQYALKCKRVCDELDDREFIGLHGKFTGCSTKVTMKCSKHGEWSSTSISHVINTNPSGCPDCLIVNSQFGRYKHRDYELDTLYLLRFTHEDGEDFIKCGRTFDMKVRLSDMNRDYNIEILATHEAIHHHIFILEGAIHVTLKEFHMNPSRPFGGSVNECFDTKCLENISIKDLFGV